LHVRMQRNGVGVSAVASDGAGRAIANVMVLRCVI